MRQGCRHAVCGTHGCACGAVLPRPTPPTPTQGPGQHTRLSGARGPPLRAGCRQGTLSSDPGPLLPAGRTTHLHGGRQEGCSEGSGGMASWAGHSQPIFHTTNQPTGLRQPCLASPSPSRKTEASNGCSAGRLGLAYAACTMPRITSTPADGCPLGPPPWETGLALLPTTHSGPTLTAAPGPRLQSPAPDPLLPLLLLLLLLQLLSLLAAPPPPLPRRGSWRARRCRRSRVRRESVMLSPWLVTTISRIGCCCCCCCC